MEFVLFDFFQDVPQTIDVAPSSLIFQEDDEIDLKQFADGKTTVKVRWGKKVVDAKVLNISNDFAFLKDLSKRIEENQLLLTDVIGMTADDIIPKKRPLKPRNILSPSPIFKGISKKDDHLVKCGNKKKGKEAIANANLRIAEDLMNLKEGSRLNKENIVPCSRCQDQSIAINAMKKEMEKQTQLIMETKSLIENLNKQFQEKSFTKANKDADCMENLADEFELPIDALKNISSQNVKKMVADFLTLAFTREELASSSLTGKKSNAVAGEAKRMLDQRKVAALRGKIK